MPCDRAPRWIWGVLTLVWLASGAHAQHAELPVSIGSTVRIWSEVLGEERQLLVYLPPHYEVSGKAYPVLYLLDAEDHFLHATGIVQFLSSYTGRIPEMIVVGVANSRLRGHRTLNLTPPLASMDEKRKLAERMPDDLNGGAEEFLGFMVDELAPWVDARYRTAPFRILMGHSLGGLFSVHAMVRRPEAFQAHIAVSPSLWWDGGAVVERLDAGIRKLRDPPWLFLSASDNEPPIGELTSKLASGLATRRVQGLVLEHRHYAGEDHGSTPHRSLYDALERLFIDWRMEPDRAGERRGITLERIDAHYSKLSARFGYPMTPPPAAYRAATWMLEERADKDEALAVLQRGVREYPHLAELHALLGEVFEKMDRQAEALVAYRNAVQAAVRGQAVAGAEVSDYCGRFRRLSGQPLPSSCPDR